MSFNLANKLKSLRKEKNISQEKLAQFLNVSYQAVSKWENGNSYPDISLLPDIARFFGITIDELLQVEKLDEKRRYQEYYEKNMELCRNGKKEESLALWQEAYHEMPNNIEVKEFLMSTYSDVDKVKYQNEIIELGMELYNSDASMYYKGQAIRQIATIYAELDKMDLAMSWAKKGGKIFHSQDILFTEIESGEEMMRDIAFCTYWFINSLFWMAVRIDNDDEVQDDLRFRQDAYKTVVQLFEAVYPNDDMEFESLWQLSTMHLRIAKMESKLTHEEGTIKAHLERALACVVKSVDLNSHVLTSPLLYQWQILGSPSDNTQLVRQMKNDLCQNTFDDYRILPWFQTLSETLEKLL